MKASTFGPGCMAAGVVFALAGGVVATAAGRRYAALMLFGAAVLSLVLAVLTSDLYYDDADVRFTPGGGER